MNKVEMIIDELQSRFDDIDFLERKVEKNNSSYPGLVVKKDGKHVSPIINLDSHLKKLEEALDDVVSAVASDIETYLKNVPEDELITENLSSWENAKDKIIAQAIGTEKNREMLETVPHREFLDMSIIYKIIVRDDSIGTAHTKITNDMINAWDVTEEDLFNQARINNPMVVKDLLGVLKDMSPGAYNDDDPNMLYIVTNEKQMFGSGTIAYPEFIEAAKAKYPEGFALLPSSIHECLFTSLEGNDPEELAKMVKFINETQVSPEEQLTDNAYIYRNNQFEVICA